MTLQTIMIVVARRYGVTAHQLVGESRTPKIAHARAIAMYLSRHVAKASLSDIARAYGGRHHTTVLHALRKVESTDLLLAAQELMVPVTEEKDLKAEESTINASLERATKLMAQALGELESAKLEIKKGHWA